MSRANAWTDEQGRVYCRYPIRKLMADSGKGRTTVVKALSDLEARELLVRKRDGNGRAGLLYLRVPENRPPECRNTDHQSAGIPATNYKNKYNNKYKNNKRPLILDYEYTGDSL